MNVLVISREVPPVGGGAGYVALHLARELVARLGYTIHIVTMACDTLPRYECQDGVHVYRIWCGRRQRESSYFFEMAMFIIRAVPFCRRLIRKHAIQLVHAHAIIPDGLIGLLTTRQNIPVIATAHGTDVPGYNSKRFAYVHKLIRPMWQHVVSRMACIVAPSNYISDLVRKSAPSARSVLIHYGIDDSIFREEELRQKTDGFLIVSRLERRKNFHLFFKAMEDIVDPTTVHVVGEGDMLPELKKMADTMPQHKITFYGWLPNGGDAWRSLYLQSRYFVFPSASENYPVCLMEAMLAQMVVLASDIPGNREVLGDCALYFEAGSVASVKEVVVNVLEGNREDLFPVAEQARKRVISNCSWVQICRKYDDLYDDAVMTSKRTGDV